MCDQALICCLVGVMYNTQTGTALINAYRCASGASVGERVSRAMDVFNDMRSRGIAVNVKTYNSLLAMFGQLDDSASMVCLYGQMEDDGIAPSQVNPVAASFPACPTLST